MTIGTARYKTLSLDEDLSGIDDIPTTCVQDCILLAFKRLQEQHFKTGQAISNSEPALDQFAESIDLLFTHRLKNKRNGFWNVAKEISCGDVIDTLSNLPFVRTNIGRARAWIYQALQDGLLTCYMAQIEKDLKLLNRFYRTDAAIRDFDFMFAVNNLLSGLDAIIFDIIIDCNSFDTGEAPSSVKRTLFGNVVDDLSLSTAADAIALQIPQIFKVFSSNSSINGSHSSLNTIDSNESSQPSLETTDTHSIVSFGDSTVNQRKYQHRKMRKKPLKQKRSSADSSRGSGRTISSEQGSSVLSDVRETLSEAHSSFGTLKENKSEDVLMLIASKLREQTGDRGIISDISVRRVLERDAGVSIGLDNSPKVENLLNLELPNTSRQMELSMSLMRSHTVAELTNGDSDPTAVAHGSSNQETMRVNHHPMSLDKNKTDSELQTSTNFEMELPRTETNYEEKEPPARKSDSGSSKSSSSHSFDRNSLPVENDVDIASSLAYNSLEPNPESEKLRDDGRESIGPTWEFSASFMSKFDQLVELSYNEEGNDNPDTIGLSDDGAILKTLRREPSDENGDKNQHQYIPSSEGTDRLLHGHVNFDERLPVSHDGYETSQENTSPSKKSVTEDCSDEISPRSNHDDCSSVDEGAKKGFSSSGSFSKCQSDVSTFPKDEEAEEQPVNQMVLQSQEINHIASALSPTVYLDQNVVTFNKCDIFIDHMTQLNFELKVFQFNNDGDEQAIKLYRGFYHHMEMPSTWTHKSYHARPIDLLVTNKAIYILKFANDKAASLHYFFPLDEITLISVYPFGQGLKIYSRRSRKTDWAKLTVNDNRRTSEFWFETGDESFTQMIVEKLHQVMALHVETSNLPSFGDTALMETVQLRKLMALTFNYEEHNDVEIQRFFLLHMAECPFLSVSHERERSLSYLRADSVVADVYRMEGILWLKQESSALGSIVKKSSHGIASLPTFAMHSSSRHKQETPVWKDFHFSIQQGVIYKAEYSENGKMGKAEPFITLSDCQSCVIYKDDDKAHAFSVGVSKSYSFSSLFQSRTSKRSSDATFYFAAKSEREQHNWINAINEFNVSSTDTSSHDKKGMHKSVPVKACAMVMDKRNAVICRYERETDEFLVMEKFSFSNVLRLILPDKNQAPTFCILDFKVTEEVSKEEDDFEIVENTALVDNMQPMCLYFCAPEECSLFISLLRKNDSSISFVNYSESGSEAAVYKQLQRTEVELKKYRKIYKL